MTQYSTIAELQNFIVLENYTKSSMVNEPPAGYQTEAALEHELIEDLEYQGYEYLPALTTPEGLLANVRKQLQTLNNAVFTDAEWQRFMDEYLDKPSDSIIDKTRKVQDDYIYDFVFDDGHIQNIYLVDKRNIARNKVQVINQFEQTGTQANRYDVTILVNGLPMVQVELKRRGLLFVKHSTKYIVTVRRVSTVSAHCINIYKSSLSLMVQILAILLTP